MPGPYKLTCLLPDQTGYRKSTAIGGFAKLCSKARLIDELQNIVSSDISSSSATLPFVSIVIPVSNADRYLFQCLEHCLALDYPQYEVILVPDKPLDGLPAKVKVYPVISKGPSLKRNAGVAQAQGHICAFIDADAYPVKDWLRKAVPYFDDPEVAAVGGPNLTPADDSLMQKANGVIFASALAGRRLKARYPKATALNSWELQSSNMLVRKSAFEELKGFEIGLWPGEDAKLSFQIMDVLKKKLIYGPEVVVYHHRRPLFRPYLKQVWRSAFTKGLLMKQFFSLRRVEYFLPTLFVLGLLAGAFLSLLNPIIKALYFAALAIYLLGTLVAGAKTRSFRLGSAVFTGLILTHLTYGAGFLLGLLRRRAA